MLKAHLGELHIYLQKHDLDLLLLLETWLDQSTESVKIPGYKEISRRDRSIKENRGGVITYARNDVQNVVHLFNSSNAER